MTDPISSRTGATPGEQPAGDHAAFLTMSPTGPQRPEAGSALERVLGRQTVAPRLLGFVPAQVR